jgi:hypothetical protein
MSQNIELALQVIADLKAEQVIPEYAIGGAIAATFYIQAVNTRDVDIFAHIPPEQASSLMPFKRAHEVLAAKGFDQWDKEGVMIHGWPVQLLPVSSPLEKEALAAAATVPFGSIQTRVFTPEYVMALALDLGRPKDKQRVISFLETPNSYSPEKLQPILKAHNLTEKFQSLKEQIRPTTRESLRPQGPSSGMKMF